MANKVSLGHNLYLWTPSGGVTAEVVISCHGGMTGGSFIAKKGTRFLFYSAATQSAFGTLDKTLHPDQVKDETNCSHDKSAWNTVDEYVLSKFQGSHGGGSESYGDIKTFVDGNGRSVISVRNRTGSHKLAADAPMTLSTVYQMMDARYPATTFLYHCLFCRVDSTGTSQYKDMLTGKAYA